MDHTLNNDPLYFKKQRKGTRCVPKENCRRVEMFSRKCLMVKKNWEMTVQRKRIHPAALKCQ